jgi:hypothetical protein
LSLSVIQDITFLTDDDGNDTGEWTTTENNMSINILKKDMGVKLDFSNMELFSFDMDN